VIKYLGSKRTLLPTILNALSGCDSVLDLFSGTSRVSVACKAAGKRVVSADYANYAHTLATCYVQTDSDRAEEAGRIITELNQLPGRAGYFTETFCRKSRFLQPFNGERVDAIREAIEQKGLDPELKAVALTSLLEAADKVDSTVGLQMAYLKEWAKRSYNPLTLALPALLPVSPHGKGLALQGDARALAGEVEVDGVYLDPPYNQHSYLGNYHVWESLVLWDAPEVYGVACKRVDTREKRSPFNSRRWARQAFSEVVQRCRARKRIVVSFSDEAFLVRQDVEAILRERGTVSVVTLPHKRHVGSQLGVFNPDGLRVGTPGKTECREYLFVTEVG